MLKINIFDILKANEHIYKDKKYVKDKDKYIYDI